MLRGREETRDMKTPHQYSFEKLRVWQGARELGRQVYLTTSTFPRAEIYGLTSQCNRAAVSVAANIAEGSSRQGRRDQAHFSEIAYSSLMELACLLVLCSDLGLLSLDAESQLRRSIEELSRQVNALHRSQRARIS